MNNVFISSTGKDLAEYRQAAIEICNRLGLTPNAMEFFESMGAGATAGSQRRLDEADVYVGIFAHRYGFIEPGYTQSVTELEFDYAGQRGLERLCFALNANTPWPTAAWDAAHYPQMQALRGKVDALIRAEFTSVDDFRVKLMQALVKWQQAQTPGPGGGHLPPALPPTPEAALAQLAALPLESIPPLGRCRPARPSPTRQIRCL